MKVELIQEDGIFEIATALSDAVYGLFSRLPAPRTEGCCLRMVVVPQPQMTH